MTNTHGPRDHGEIQLQLSYDDYDGTLNIHVIQARNLQAKDRNGLSDPFVKVYLLPGRSTENKRRTKYIPRTLDPEWNQTLVFLGLSREELSSKALEITVWDYDRFKPNDFLGEVVFDLSDEAYLDNKPHWYRLHAHDDSATSHLSQPHTLSPPGSSSSSTSHRSRQSSAPSQGSHHQQQQPHGTPSHGSNGQQLQGTPTHSNNGAQQQQQQQQQHQQQQQQQQQMTPPLQPQQQQSSAGSLSHGSSAASSIHQLPIVTPPQSSTPSHGPHGQDSASTASASSIASSRDQPPHLSPALKRSTLVTPDTAASKFSPGLGRRKSVGSQEAEISATLTHPTYSPLSLKSPLIRKSSSPVTSNFTALSSLDTYPYSSTLPNGSSFSRHPISERNRLTEEYVSPQKYPHKSNALWKKTPNGSMCTYPQDLPYIMDTYRELYVKRKNKQDCQKEECAYPDHVRNLTGSDENEYESIKEYVKCSQCEAGPACNYNLDFCEYCNQDGTYSQQVHQNQPSPHPQDKRPLFTFPSPYVNLSYNGRVETIPQSTAADYAKEPYSPTNPITNGESSWKPTRKSKCAALDIDQYIIHRPLTPSVSSGTQTDFDDDLSGSPPDSPFTPCSATSAASDYPVFNFDGLSMNSTASYSHFSAGYVNRSFTASSETLQDLSLQSTRQCEPSEGQSQPCLGVGQILPYQSRLFFSRKSDVTSYRVMGDLLLGLQPDDTDNTLLVYIMKCCNMKSKTSTGKSKCWFMTSRYFMDRRGKLPKRQKTRSAQIDSNPTFNEIVCYRLHVLQGMVQLELWSTRGALGHKKKAGEVLIDLEKVPFHNYSNAEVIEWYKLILQ